MATHTASISVADSQSVEATLPQGTEDAIEIVWSKFRVVLTHVVPWQLVGILDDLKPEDVLWLVYDRDSKTPWAYGIFSKEQKRFDLRKIENEPLAVDALFASYLEPYDKALIIDIRVIAEGRIKLFVCTMDGYPRVPRGVLIHKYRKPKPQRDPDRKYPRESRYGN